LQVFQSLFQKGPGWGLLAISFFLLLFGTWLWLIGMLVLFKDAAGPGIHPGPLARLRLSADLPGLNRQAFFTRKAVFTFTFFSSG
jgi:hypothetical protein